MEMDCGVFPVANELQLESGFPAGLIFWSGPHPMLARKI